MDLKKIIEQKKFTKEDIIYLLGLNDSHDVNSLLLKSREVKENYLGKDASMRGVIKFSNYCTSLCAPCRLRENNFGGQRYRLSTDEILCAVGRIYDDGIRTIFLQSGQDNYYNTDLISFLIYSIKKKYEVAVWLNIGERKFDEYMSWKIAGVDGYFLKHKSANPDLYPEYHSGFKYEERNIHIKYLKHLGYQIGTGNIIGLPKQELNDIADDIISSKELGVDMLSIGHFFQAKFTQEQNHKTKGVKLTLKTIAVARLVLPNINIAVTLALDSIDKSGENIGLDAGANVILTNFTPPPYRGIYQINSNKPVFDNDPLDNHEMIKAGIEYTGSICWQ